MTELQNDLQNLCDAIVKRTLTTDTEYPVEEFEKAVCKIFETTIREIRAENRKEEVVITRQLCMWYMRGNTLFSLAKIGRRYKKDHATVLHAIKTINEIIETKNKRFYPRIEQFINQMTYEKRKTINTREIID